MTEDRDAIAAVETMKDTAKRLGLMWVLRMASITTSTPVTAIYDGDTTPIGMVSMIGPVADAERVYAIFVPPSGNFIVGRVTGPGLVGRVDSTSSSGAIGAEATVLTTPVINFQAGHAYKVSWRGQTATSIANSTAYRVRQTSSVGTLLNVFQFEVPASDSDTFMDSFYLQVATNVSDVLVLTLQASAGTSNMTASTTNVRFLEVYDVGPASQYANAISI